MDKERPILDKRISVKDFKDFYWLKIELVNFCRENGISSVNGKIEISNRIIEYLETGKIPRIKTQKKDAIEFWKIKRAKRGSNKCSKQDLI